MKEKDQEIFRSLMGNKDFKDWVTNPSGNRNQYWEKWIEAHPEHKEVIEKARNAILKLNFKEDYLSENELEEVLHNVITNKRSTRNAIRKRGVSNNATWWLKIAATLLIIAVSINLFRYILNGVLETPQQHVMHVKKAYNPEGIKSRISLPDGSTVHLNAGSMLLFPEEFTDTLRVVELDGEAFFDVEEDQSRPFVVKTGTIETEVLGTSFNVRAFTIDDEINVALVNGKVKVKGENQNSLESNHVLLPGEKLTYDKNRSSYTKSHFDITEETGWKDEILVFNNADFSHFVTLVERWYGVDIIVEKAPAKTWNVNGHFKNETLEEVLIGVQFTHEVEYKIENKVVTLNCK